jgi:hypothetical protein
MRCLHQPARTDPIFTTSRLRHCQIGASRPCRVTASMSAVSFAAGASRSGTPVGVPECGRAASAQHIRHDRCAADAGHHQDLAARRRPPVPRSRSARVSSSVSASTLFSTVTRGFPARSAAIGVQLVDDRIVILATTSSDVPSTRCSSTEQRSTWPRNRVSPSPLPSCAPSIRPGMSAIDDIPPRRRRRHRDWDAAW